MATFSEIINSPQPVLVDFFAEWCGPCKFMAPELVKLADRLGQKAKVIKVDIDKNPSVAQRLNIRSVPTLVIFKQGQIVWRQSGAMGANELEKVLTQYI